MSGKKSLYLKFRPTQLSDVVGQPNVVRTLHQASVRDEFSHAYLFSGNHGCGKTSTARILSTLMTCENINDGKICGKCRACKGIHIGASLDIKEIDGATKRKIEDIRELIEGASWSPNELKRKIFIIDECLGKDSRVETASGLIPISRIVNEKMDIKVRSYNEKDGIVEFKKITAYHKNSGKDVHKFHFEGLGALYAADNHRVMTPQGWKKAGELNVGDEVCRRGTKLNIYQEQVALGSLLGDANISRNKNRFKNYSRTNARMRFVHGHKQHDYLKWKLDVFGAFSKQKEPRLNKLFGFAKKPTSYVNTVTSSQFNRIQDITYEKGKKIVTDNWLNKISPIGMSIWFCDDGSLNRIKTKSGYSNYVTLHTQGFSRDENELIKKWLYDKWTVTSTVMPVKNGLFRISMDKDGSESFLKIIAKHVPLPMRHKLKGFWGDEEFDSEIVLNSNDDELITEKITNKEFVRYESSTYDLEVEDNHNYFVSGTLVHNCHQLTKEATSALLKILEEPPSYLTFILCTTEIKKILPTILSRCQRFNFSKINSTDITSRLSYIAKEEGINVDEEALVSISKMARGSMRDAIGYLDQVATVAASKRITEKGISSYFGIVDRKSVFNIINAILSSNIPIILDQVNDMIMSSADTSSILYEISDMFRNAMVIKAQGGDSRLIDLPDYEIQQLKKISDKLTMGQLLKLAKLFSDIEKKINFNINERWIMEATLINCVAILRQKK